MTFVLLCGWLAVPLLATFFFWKRKGLGRARPQIPPAQEPKPASWQKRFSGQAHRDMAGALQVRLVAGEQGIVDFANELMAATPESMVRRDADLSTFAFPCHVVAIPDDGLVFDIRPLALDPRSELAELEAHIMRTAASEAGLPAAPSRTGRRL